MLAVLLNLIPIPPSSQGVAAAEAPPEVTPEVPLEVTPEAPTETPPPVSTINWERIKTVRKKLQQEAIETYSHYNK